MEWQPIETAPKDGSRFLAWIGDNVTIVSWSVAEPFGKDKSWSTDIEGPGYSSGYEEGEVSHWMPLPEPPLPLHPPSINNHPASAR